MAENPVEAEKEGDEETQNDDPHQDGTERGTC
jgi:hypothetical protein